jgi:hypothetical protein
VNKRRVHAASPRSGRLRIRGGVAELRENWKLDRGDYWVVPQSEVRIDRQDAGRGGRHLITVPQLRSFIELLPDWGEAAVGLRAIVLEAVHPTRLGRHWPHIVAISAWETSLWWRDTDPWFVDEHADLLDQLGVEQERVGGRIELRWTQGQARAFQLLHILPHELGHHHDRITTRSRGRAARGEAYAEAYVLRVAAQVYDTYTQRFEI